jgi:ribosomal protein S18 acetylase RimI-like enzyme
MMPDDFEKMPKGHHAETPQEPFRYRASVGHAAPRIRDMTKTDLHQVGDILFEAFSGGASKYGYAPRISSAQEGASWAWVLLRHGPRELLVAEVENRVVGICCLNPRGDHGGVGPVAVDPSFQSRGMGRQMMDALLVRAEGLQSVRLFQEAFNPASFSLYYSLDFMPVADLLDLSLNGEVRRGTDHGSKISELAAADLDALCAYDIPRSRLDRRADFAYYGKWGKVFVYRERTEVRGYIACLPGAQSVQLGPLVAEGEEEALCLFRHAVGFFGDRPCQTRVMARDHMLVKSLKKLGFQLYCLNVLMVRGPWRQSTHVEAFGRFPEGA